VLQLTPEGIELFDAGVTDLGNRLRCIVSGVPRPREQFSGQGIQWIRNISRCARFPAAARAERPSRIHATPTETHQPTQRVLDRRDRSGTPGTQRRIVRR